MQQVRQRTHGARSDTALRYEPTSPRVLGVCHRVSEGWGRRVPKLSRNYARRSERERESYFAIKRKQTSDCPLLSNGKSRVAMVTGRKAGWASRMLQFAVQSFTNTGKLNETNSRREETEEDKDVREKPAFSFLIPPLHHSSALEI